jgi:hypothetical protein
VGRALARLGAEYILIACASFRRAIRKTDEPGYRYDSSRDDDRFDALFLPSAFSTIAAYSYSHGSWLPLLLVWLVKVFPVANPSLR